MDRTFRRYLLNSVAAFAPPDPPNGDGENQDQGGADSGDDLDLGVDDLGNDQGGDDQGGDQGSDGQDGDDDQDDDQAGDDDDQGGAQPEHQSRGDRTIGELRRTARETARTNAELTRRLAELEGTVAAVRQQRVEPQESASQRAERLALLSPEERMQEMLNSTLAQHERNNQVLQANLFDQSDKMQYETRANANPLLRKIEPEVERIVQDQRSKGLSYDRNTIAAFIIGQKVLAKNSQQNPGRQQRRAQQRARPLNPGSNNAGQQRQRRGGAPSTAEDYEQQFGDVSI